MTVQGFHPCTPQGASPLDPFLTAFHAVRGGFFVGLCVSLPPVDRGPPGSLDGMASPCTHFRFAVLFVINVMPQRPPKQIQLLRLACVQRNRQACSARLITNCFRCISNRDRHSCRGRACLAPTNMFVGKYTEYPLSPGCMPAGGPSDLRRPLKHNRQKYRSRAKGAEMGAGRSHARQASRGTLRAKAVKCAQSI